VDALGNRLPAGTRPPRDPRRVSDHNGVSGHIASDDGARTDHRAQADVQRGDERCMGADGGAVFYPGAIPVRSARVGGARMSHVGELGARTDEDVLPEHDPGPNARMALEPCPRPNRRAARDETERADDDIRPELRPLHDDGRRVDARRGAGAWATVHPARRR
jgi:hypothetical protein